MLEGSEKMKGKYELIKIFFQVIFIISLVGLFVRIEFFDALFVCSLVFSFNILGAFSILEVLDKDGK